MAVRRLLATSGLGLLIQLGVFPGSIAQAASAAGSPPQKIMAQDTAIEEVIVTARRKEERQQDVPLAITTLNDEFLREKSIVNLHDLNGQVPSLNIDSYNSPGYTNVGIRGQRSTNVAPGQDSAVGYYFAEVNYAFPVGISGQMFDLQSLEVIKGPQGTLFGRNTTGGAIAITPAKPTSEFGGSVTMGMTEFKHGSGYYATGVLNLPVSDVLMLRAAVNTINHDGYVKNTIGARLGQYAFRPDIGTSSANLNNEESTSWRLSALLKPSPDVESLFLAQGGTYDDDGIAYSLLALNPASAVGFALGIAGLNASNAYQGIRAAQGSDFWSTASGLKAYNRQDTWGVSNTTTWKLSDTLTVKNIIGYRDFKLDQALSFGGFPTQVLDVMIGDHGKEWSEEFQLQGQALDKRLNWVAGLYYANQEIRHPRSTLAVPQFGGSRNHAVEDSDNDSYAIFAQGTYQLPAVEGLSLTVGLRNTKDNRKMKTSAWSNMTETAASCAIIGGTGCVLQGDISYRVTTYNFGLEYKLDPETLMYVARRKGYRAGGWNYVGVSSVDFGPFSPEYVVDTEVGLKKDWHLGGATLRTNVAFYKSKLTDAQKFVSPITNINQFMVVNAANATINGGEIEITLIPVPGLELGGYIARTDGKYGSFKFGGNDYTNNKFSQTPKNQYALRAKYDLPFDESIGKITLQADYTHKSEYFYTDTAQTAPHGPSSSQRQDEYGILNLRADWKSVMKSKFDVAAYVKNANSTKYNQFGVMIYQALGYNVATIGEPRIFGLEASYHF